MSDNNRIREEYLSIEDRGIDNTEGIKSKPFCCKVLHFVENFSVPTPLADMLIPMVVSMIVWLSIYTIVGQQNLPGGVIFVLVFLEFGGRTTGYLISLVRLPPMVAMLGLGIMIRNVPYIDFGQYLPSNVASPIRQLSLAVILTRAGLGLDINILTKYKWLIARLAVVPTVTEACCMAVLVHFILQFPWLWSFIAGFVISAVSPAVIVPRILALKEEGYGEEKGIPTIILAAASIDNIISIAFFGVFIGITMSSKTLAMSLLQGPMEVGIGLASGVAWGLFCGLIVPRPETKMTWDATVLKFLLLVGGSVSSVLGFNKLGYSGAGVLSCLIMSFTTASIWRKRGTTGDFETIRWGFTFLWKFFEPLLFGVIGCQVVISTLDKNTVTRGIGCIAISALVRFGTTFFVGSKSGMVFKEKLFCSIAWIPKATVQAAIGPMALDLAQEMHNDEFEVLGKQVLTLAVLVILMTAAIGELGVIIGGPLLLAKRTSVNENDS